MQFLHGYSDSVYVGDTSLGTYPFRINKKLSAVQAGEEFVKYFNEAPNAQYAREAFEYTVNANSGIRRLKLDQLTTVKDAQLALLPIEKFPSNVQYPDASIVKKATFFFKALETIANKIPALSSVINSTVLEFQNKPFYDLAWALSDAIGRVKGKEKDKERSIRMRNKILLGGGILLTVGVVYFSLSRRKTK
jgi:hypothetical protein